MISHVSKRFARSLTTLHSNSMCCPTSKVPSSATMIRWYRGDSGEMQSRSNLVKNNSEVDEITERESKLLDIAKPKSEQIYAKHISLPKMDHIAPHALGKDMDMDMDMDMNMETEQKQELELNIRRKRLVYRSKQRGWLEVDILLGTWANENVDALNAEELDDFEAFVNLETIDIYNIITLRTNVPEELKGGTNIVERIQEWARQSPLGKADPLKYSEVKGKNNLI